MHFKKQLIGMALVGSFAGHASAALMFDQDLAQGVVFGSGNANGGFTVETLNGIEIGLRAKVRFDENNEPQNVFNSNGDGSYSFAAGAPMPGFGFQPNSPSTAPWNFEWSVDVTGTQMVLDSFSYLMEIDYDPTSATNFLTFDPINNPNDNAGGDFVNQNSWNLEFFDQPGFEYLNTASGEFDIRLSAFDASQNLLASSSIVVRQNAANVPVPAPLALLGLGLAGLGWSRRKKA